MKALVTGASAGIGRDIAINLAGRGYELILVARRTELLNELAKTLPTHAEVISCDLSCKDECRALYEKTREAGVDMLVNNAGFGLIGAFGKTDLDTELNMIDVNIRAVHILTKLFLRDFIEKDTGFILNVSSSAGFLPGPLMATYYASKAYVLWLSEAIWKELKKMGSRVQISALCPGPVPTDFNRIAKAGHISGRGLSSACVAEYAIEKTLAGKRVIVPGIGMKIALGVQRMMPKRLLLAFCYRRMLHKGPEI